MQNHSKQISEVLGSRYPETALNVLAVRHMHAWFFQKASDWRNSHEQCSALVILDIRRFCLLDIRCVKICITE